jgi:hypothetical protein
VIRRLITLAIVFVIGYAGWNVAPVMLSHFEFKTKLDELARFSGDRAEGEIQARVLKLAEEYGIPLTERDVQVVRQADRIRIDVAYRRMLKLVPRYEYPWDFTIRVEVMAARMRSVP